MFENGAVSVVDVKVEHGIERLVAEFAARVVIFFDNRNAFLESVESDESLVLGVNALLLADKEVHFVDVHDEREDLKHDQVHQKSK